MRGSIMMPFTDPTPLTSRTSSLCPFAASASRTGEASIAGVSSLPSTACGAYESRKLLLITAGCSSACCTGIPNSATFRKNCSCVCGCVSAPGVPKTRNGLPSFSASAGLIV